jgi:hypothetical protein
MFADARIQLTDDQCPISEETLAKLYRGDPRGLAELITTVESDVRALLALYCYRRAHLESIGLAIAASCEKDDLSAVGGNAGAALFERSRRAFPPSIAERKVSLSSGPLCNIKFVDED